MKKLMFLIISIACAQLGISQPMATVNIKGDTNQILSITKENYDNERSKQPRAKLFTGEEIRVGCSGGSCAIVMTFKDGSEGGHGFADFFENVDIFEYDFGNDGVMELCYYTEESMTQGKQVSFGVLKYGAGQVMPIYQKDIPYYRLDIEPTEIRFYISNRLEDVKIYRKGKFHTINWSE